MILFCREPEVNSGSGSNEMEVSFGNQQTARAAELISPRCVWEGDHLEEIPDHGAWRMKAKHLEESMRSTNK